MSGENELGSEEQRDRDHERRLMNKNLREIISDQKMNLEFRIENTAFNARLLGARFKVLMEEDFTREEAMSIIVHRGLA